MDNQASNTDDGAASVRQTPPKKRSQATDRSPLATNAGASRSSATGSESSNSEFFQRPSFDTHENQLPLTSSFQVAPNTGFAFSIGSPGQRANSSDIIPQGDLEGAAKAETPNWSFTFGRNDSPRDNDTSMKFSFGCPSKKRKFSGTLASPRSSAFEADSSPTKKSNSIFAAVSVPSSFSVPAPSPLPDSSDSQDITDGLDIADDDAAEFDPPSGIDHQGVEYDWRISGVEPVSQGNYSRWKSVGSGYSPSFGAVDLSVSRAFTFGQSRVEGAFNWQSAEGCAVSGFRQAQDAYSPAIGSSAVDYSNSFVGFENEAFAMSGGQPPSAGGQPVQDASAETSNDVSALLEARGLSSQFLSGFSSRMHHLNERAAASAATVKQVQEILQRLEATKEEDEQLAALIELCQLLVMGNEETLAGFPIRQAVPILIKLLRMEHNFDIMHQACRALTYLMEGLPRSSPAVVEAVPLFLEKLQSIECMDVAEQALRALEILSKKHSKAILQRNGVAASLMFIDFFSMTAQRAALSLTANCCLNMTVEDFLYVQDSLPVITSRLVNQDKKLVESACLCLARLVDNYQAEERILKQIAVHGLLTDIQQLLFVTPSIISTCTLVTVLRMLVVMCYNCPDLAIILLKLNVAETLSYLLVGTSDKGRTSSPPELIPRSSQELYEIVSLIGELMPLLPTDGLFAIDSLFGNNNIGLTKQTSVWQWKDESEMWRSYNSIDNRIIEKAHQAGEEDVCLTTMGRAYIIDFNIMQQVNEDTGTTRQVQRMVNAPSIKPDSASIKGDSRADVLNENSDLANGLTTALFAVLFEVYNSSAALYLRHKCLRTLLRMLFYGSIDLLSNVLQSVSVSSHVAAMLSSNDLQTVISAIQMCNILMSKLPDIFSIYFRRQGVLHQMNKLIQSTVIDLSTKKKTPSVSPGTSAPQGGSAPSSASASPGASAPLGAFAQQAASPGARPGLVLDKSPTSSKDDAKQSSPAPQLRLSDVLKRKKPARKPSKKSSKADDDNNAVVDPGPSSFFSPSSSSSQSPSSSRSGTSTSHSRLFGVRDGKMGGLTPRTFLASLNPTRWGRSSQSVSDRPLVTRKPSLSKTSPEVLQPTVNNREIIKQWISDQSSKFIEKYFDGDVEGLSHPSLAIFSQLSSSASLIGQDPSTDVKYLEHVASIVSLNDVSPFEVIHSGLIKQLLSYFTSSADATDARLKTFVQVFIGQPRVEGSEGHGQWHLLNPSPLLHLVHKLMACFHHLEQFQIKVHDLNGEAPSNRGVQVVQLFNAHHIKCDLRPHPDSAADLQLWKGGAITIDPFAPVTTIERYVLTKGSAKTVRNSEETDEEEDDIEDDDDDDLDDDDDDDDEDPMDDGEMEDALAMATVASKPGKHVLEFCIGDHVVPYNLTIYQAVKQFGRASESTDADAESEHPLPENVIWKQSHVLWYRPVSSANYNKNEDMQTSEKTKPDKTSKTASNPVAEQVMTGDGVSLNRLHVLKSCLVSALPSSVTVDDPSLDVLALLRILHSLNSDWTSVFDVASSNTPLAVCRQEFVSNKLTAKANRQLQDPIIVMTGHLPQWLMQIANVCPFLLPFENRLLLFCATSLDRDRAVQRIQDLTMREPTAMDGGNERQQLGNRLERKKKIICRDDLLKQAEAAVNDLIGSRAILEIQYENEVGSGLGPTLEFYALVSQELQQADLELWRGEKRALPSTVKGCEEEQQYFYSSCGLFPAPLPKNVKAQVLRRIKSKFTFLGKFMARALIDCRILDLPLSPLFYKWLLGQESTLCVSDLQFLDHDLFSSISKLQILLADKKKIESDPSHSPERRKFLLENVTLDGCTIEDLTLDFVLPGYPNVELKKGGKDISVTLDNLEEYIQLVAKWSLVHGVQHQFEAVREGFESIFSLPSLSLFFVEELLIGPLPSLDQPVLFVLRLSTTMAQARSVATARPSLGPPYGVPSLMDQLFCGSQQEYWNVKYLTEVCQTDHGYTHDSHAVKSLFSILSSYSQEDQRLFLQFVTGSPRLPVGGLRSLNPPLTIVRKTDSKDYADDFLPSVMTCVNYLKLPDYSSTEVMRSKLAIAIREGQLSFLLS